MSFPLDGTKQQRRGAKRAVPQVTLHTSENAPGTPNSALAGFIRTRSDYGSYHCIVDTEARRTQLAGFWAMTWHCPAVNGFAMGLSAVTRAADWSKLSTRARNNLVKGLAYEAHRYSRWCVAQGSGPVPARRISGPQAISGMHGFSTHGEIQPRDRTDPGKDFPWTAFLAEFRRLEGGGSASTPAPAKPSTPAPKPAPAPKPVKRGHKGWARVKPHKSRAAGILRTSPSTKGKAVRTLYANERLLLDGTLSGSWARVGTGSLWIHTMNIEPVKVGPVLKHGLFHGQFPDKDIVVSNVNSWEYRHARVDLAARMGESKGSTNARWARMLKKRHANLRSVNGNVRTVKRYLASVGMYKGNIDNKDNAPYRIACKRFLNSQRKHYTPKPPKAHRWAKAFKG